MLALEAQFAMHQSMRIKIRLALYFSDFIFSFVTACEIFDSCYVVLLVYRKWGVRMICGHFFT